MSYGCEVCVISENEFYEFTRENNLKIDFGKIAA